MSQLPGVLSRIAAVAGEAAALQLARERGGTELKPSARPKGVLARIVGLEAARRIVDELGGEKITIPMATARGAGGRRAAAARMLAAGRGATETALACDVHERTVRRVKGRMDGPAGPLFEDE